MKDHRQTLSVLIILLAGLIYLPAQAQQKNGAETQNAPTANGPNRIVRNIIQDSKGNIWIASWQGVFRYDGKSFTNVTGKISSDRFYAVLEDKKGNFWFGTVSAGVYYYDGKTFRNFTTRDGLAYNGAMDIHEDKTGKIWFATEAGASRYDGKSFQTFMMKEGPRANPGDSVRMTANEADVARHNDVNAIMEDRTGNFWFGTKGYASVYDGKTFTVFNHDGKPFSNVRSIIEDKKGNIWLGGTDGLWRYDGRTFTNFTKSFIGYIYEDKKGNIWTASQDNGDNKNVDLTIAPLATETRPQGTWALSRYDAKSLTNAKPTVTQIKSRSAMIAGILEANDGSIWFGTSDGVSRYDGKTIVSFNGKEGVK